MQTEKFITEIQTAAWNTDSKKNRGISYHVEIKALSCEKRWLRGKPEPNILQMNRFID